MGKSQSKAGTAFVQRVDDTFLRGEVDMAARAALVGKGDSDLLTRVQINCSTKTLSREAYYCVVGYERVAQEPWKFIGVTETSSLTAEPNFIKSFGTNFTFEAPQRIRLALYRLVSPKDLVPPTSGKDFIIPRDAHLLSNVDFALAEAIAVPGGCLVRGVDRGGKMSIYVEELKMMQSTMTFALQLNALDCSKTKQTSKNKKAKVLYLCIYRTPRDVNEEEEEETPLVLRTEPRQCSIDSTGHIREIYWDNLQVSVNAMCRGEPKRQITIKLYETLGKEHICLGACTTYLKQLDAASHDGTGHLVMTIPETEASVGIHSIEIQHSDSFLDYVIGGLDLSLFVALDFTKSNKDYTVPGSLHSFNDPENPNDYVRAIQSVVDILQHYDADKKYPVYGFGARLPPSYSHTSHCFACNGDYFHPEVAGIDEIVRVYQQAATSVVLHGPTNFNEIVRVVANYAEPYSYPEVGHQKYSILLILTDGVITDMKQTVNELVRAADFPMSLVIVGIGDEDFGLMKILDGDDHRLYSTELHKFAERDIVQFVQFNRFKYGPLHELAMETLAEIPREVVAYFRSKNIVPYRKKETGAAAPASDSVSGDEDLSDMQKQLRVEKEKYIENVRETYPDIDEFDVFTIINQDKLPCNDLTYFKDLAMKAPRGANILTLPRTVGPDGERARAASGSPSGRKSLSGSRVKTSPPSTSMTGLPSPRASPQQSRHDQAVDIVCKVCFNNRVETVLVPCGHAVVCGYCAETIDDVCPICRKGVSQILKTFAA